MKFWKEVDPKSYEKNKGKVGEIEDRVKFALEMGKIANGAYKVPGWGLMQLKDYPDDYSYDGTEVDDDEDEEEEEEMVEDDEVTEAEQA